MKKSLSIQSMFGDSDFYERFDLARAAGFDYVEFGDWTDLDLSRVGEKLRANSLRLARMSATHNHSLADPNQREEFLEFLSQSIAVAKSFACGNLTIESHGDGPAELPDPTRRGDFTRIAAVTRLLMDAADKARRAGLTLLLRPVSIECDPESFVNTTSAAGSVVRVVNSPALMLLYDVTRMQPMEGQVLGAIRKYRDLIGYVHIGAGAAASATVDREIDLRRFKKMLSEELGYNGIVGFECRGDGNTAACLEEIRAF